MSGHNKWSKVKRYKEAADKRRGAMFSKILKEIMVAARGGTDPGANPRLRKVIIDARNSSIPKENIERAIKKGAGELDDGTHLEELIYEGFGPGGVGIMVECVTDNRLRTQPELRKIFEKHEGALAEKGAVAWAFEKRGVILVNKGSVTEESLMNLAVEAGADDMNSSEDGFEIQMSPTKFEDVRSTLEKAGIAMPLAELSFIATTRVKVSGEATQKIEKLAEILDDHDDVQRVTHNAEFE